MAGLQLDLNNYSVDDPRELAQMLARVILAAETLQSLLPHSGFQGRDRS